jgi:hypothetical protein
LQDIANYDPAILEPEALVTRAEELGYDLSLSRVSVVVDLAQFTHLATSYRLRSEDRTPEIELQSLKLGRTDWETLRSTIMAWCESG